MKVITKTYEVYVYSCSDCGVDVETRYQERHSKSILCEKCIDKKLKKEIEEKPKEIIKLLRDAMISEIRVNPDGEIKELIFQKKEGLEIIEITIKSYNQIFVEKGM
jgi:recombinational DNA repair protein (RecF pathway)